MKRIIIAISLLCLPFILLGQNNIGTNDNEQANEIAHISPPKTPAERKKLYESLAIMGDAVSQYKLALCYDDGIGVPQNYGEALKWYRKSAEQGVPQAQHNLGFMYALGNGVRQSWKEAAKWFQQAADQDHTLAQFALAQV